MHWCQAYSVRTAGGNAKSPLAASFASRVWVGLAFSSAGDALLRVHDAGVRDDDLYFVLGLASFLIGHIFYVVGFAVGGSLLSFSTAALPFYGCTLSRVVPGAHMLVPLVQSVCAIVLTRCLVPSRCWPAQSPVACSTT